MVLKDANAKDCAHQTTEETASNATENTTTNAADNTTNSATDSTFNGKRSSWAVRVAIVATWAVGVFAVAMKRSPQFKSQVVSLFPDKFVESIEDLTNIELSVRAYRPPPEKRILFSESDLPKTPFSFTVHFNGDGLSEGYVIDTIGYNGLNAVIRSTCVKLDEIKMLAKNDTIVLQRLCDPDQGAKLFSTRGVRVMSLMDIAPNTRTYIVPQGLLFVWPISRVGDMYYPEAIDSPVPDKAITLKQLSMSPRVFSVENFMSPEEITTILENNEDQVKPSEVGFSGWRDSTRTSSTAWDFHSWAARKVQRRAFALLGMDFDKDMADATQVLRYNISEWYKPHTDWFDSDAFTGHDPQVNNGTNRFATVFLYLTDVEAGGNTVFPFSKTHEGYNGEQLTVPGTENTAGYISQADAEWVCNVSSTALRSQPKAGNAVLFYSQGPDGALDPLSLHGGCPVIKGTKWSANVWVWNRHKPGQDKALDKKPDNDNSSINMQFLNTLEEEISLFWEDGSEEGMFQNDIKPGEYAPMTTYHGHIFFARIKGAGSERIFTFKAHDDQDEALVAKIVLQQNNNDNS